MSDDEDYDMQQSRDQDKEDEGGFINFLQQLTEVQFDLPMYYHLDVRVSC